MSSDETAQNALRTLTLARQQTARQVAITQRAQGLQVVAHAPELVVQHVLEHNADR